MQPDYDCACTGSLSSRSETRPLRSLPSFRMMEDYETALLRSHQTHSDLIVSLVSGKAAPQVSHRIYGLYFLSMKKTPQSPLTSPARDDDRWASVCLQ